MFKTIMSFTSTFLSIFSPKTSSRPPESTLVPLLMGGEKMKESGSCCCLHQYQSGSQWQRNNMRKRTILGGMVLAAILFVVILTLGVTSSANDDTKQLKLLHVIMRHGARTPADTYPNDPHANATFYPIGWGQLTNEGKLALYNTGKFLRTRYSDFLGEFYSPQEYYTESTDVDRTMASMQLVNAGLWPPHGYQQWGPLDWQPVPVHSTPLDQDKLLLVRRPCAQYHLELDEVMKRDDVTYKKEGNRQLFENLTRNTGKQVKDFDDVQDIYSTLRAEEAFNLTLPEWTKNYYPQKLLEPAVFSYVLNAYTDKLKRLKGGVLLKKLISDWREVSAGNSKRKAFLYGGHDSTIANLLSTLKVWDPQIPEYGIAILLEFLTDKINNQNGVRIYLRNSTNIPPYLLKIPGCDTFCPLDKLIELTEPVVPDNWEEECESDDPSYQPPPPGGP